MFDLDRVIRPHLKSLKPYSSARDEYTGSEGVFLDANENSIGSATGAFNRYPDPYQRQLKLKLADLKGVAPDHIFLGNGSDEPIDLLYRAFCEPQEDNVIINPPTYGMYQVSADIHNIEVQKTMLTANFQLDPGEVISAINDRTKIIWICTPNNPTGNLLDPQSIKTVLRSFEGIVVVDEAYIDFTNSDSWIHSLSEYQNLVVLQTFSKAWGMAGLRLGAACASKAIIDLLNKIKSPYNLSQPTQEIALMALSNYDHVVEMTKKLIASREVLKRELLEIEMVKEVYPSEANFLLVKFEAAAEIFQFLINEKVIVRDRSKVMMCEDGLRITVGTTEENNVLIQKLKEFTQI